MKRLCLKVGLSYTMKGFSCKAGIPFDINDEKAAVLLETGRFVEIPPVMGDEVLPGMGIVPVGDGTPSDINDDSDGAILTADAVSNMKKAELERLAAEKDIDISGCRNKEDIVNMINNTLGLAGMMQMGSES